MIENKTYFVDRINSSKANQFTEVYHYSGTGFKKAQYNLGIFRKEDKLLVGVLQWGTSYAVNISLNRYVQEPIKISEYLELNRFCMADSEGKNSESQAISLGIKWIKQNLPHIRLLVSYAGRKEGNYGYIYQATNWEYIGYFISPGFWLVDGEERHQTTLWYRHTKHNPSIGFRDDIISMYQDVRQTMTKQFVYIIRLDKHLTPWHTNVPYPKPATDYPIMTQEKIYKQNDEVFNNYKRIKKEPVYFYWEEESEYFLKKTLKRQESTEYVEPINYSTKQPTSLLIGPKITQVYAQYDVYGHLEKVNNTMKSFINDEFKKTQLGLAFHNGNSYKNKFFKIYNSNEEIPEQIDVPIIAIVDEIPFVKIQDIANYLNVSKQAVSQAKSKKSKQIKNTKVVWMREPD